MIEAKIKLAILIGRTLVLVGIILITIRWAFELEEIGYWTLAPLIPGVALTFIGQNQESKR